MRATPKLTDEQVAEVLLSTERTIDLARRYGSSDTVISLMRTLKHRQALRVAGRLGLLKPVTAAAHWPRKGFHDAA